MEFSNFDFSDDSSDYGSIERPTNNIPPNPDDLENSKANMLRAIDSMVEKLEKYKSLIQMLDTKSEKAQTHLIQAYDMVKQPQDKDDVLVEGTSEKYLWEMETASLKAIENLLLKLQTMVSLGKIISPSTNLVVEIPDCDSLSFVGAMNSSNFGHTSYYVDLKRFPYTKFVQCHHYETESIDVASKFIDAFLSLDSKRVLEHSTLTMTSSKESTELSKDFVDGMTASNLLGLIHLKGWDILSPFAVRTTKVLFGQYTSPGWDTQTEDKLAKKIPKDEKKLTLEVTPYPKKKLKRVMVGRLKILFFKGVYPGVNWMVLKCRFSSSSNGIYQFKDK